MSFRAKSLVAASLAVILSACSDSSLENKTGKALYQEAAQQLYADKTQYNFKADFLINADTSNPMLNDLAIKLSGAADNSNRRYEFTPEVQAAIFTFKLPMLLDGKKNEALLDTSSVLDTALLFAPQAQQEIQQYKNKFIRFSPDNFSIEENELAEAMVIVSEVLNIAHGTLNEFYQAIPESSIEKRALDAKAKEIGAKVLLNIKLDQQQSKVLQQHINGYLQSVITANEKLPENFKEEFLSAFNESQNDNGYENSEVMMYLNEKGQVIHEINTMNYEVDGETISIRANIDYSNYGKANFTIQPKPEQIINFTAEHMQALQNL